MAGPVYAIPGAAPGVEPPVELPVGAPGVAGVKECEPPPQPARRPASAATARVELTLFKFSILVRLPDGDDARYALRHTEIDADGVGWGRTIRERVQARCSSLGRRSGVVIGAADRHDRHGRVNADIAACGIGNAIAIRRCAARQAEGDRVGR